MQIPHLATTYAAVNTLISLHREEALRSIDRKALYRYFMRMKQDDGSFVLHDNGESDVRLVYRRLANNS